MKSLLSMADLSLEDIYGILDLAEEMKEKRSQGKITDHLRNKSLGMIFEKSSTRTRVSFEVGMNDLGGHAVYLNSNDIQIGRGETVEDTAKVLSRYLNGIMARVYSHDTLVKLAENASVPVINALSDKEHPCQVLADLLTIKEYKNRISDMKFVWVGDGNNVCNSLMLACAIVGMEIVAACPKGYEPAEEFIIKTRELGGVLTITDNPLEAAADADILYTDVWVSMGDEEEEAKRLKDFEGYQINEELIAVSKPDVIVMHCLPAHRGLEISAGAIDGPHSVVFDQAENRLHAQKAVLLKLMMIEE
ncbi:Ornithine carbamoyltransferase [Methanimicrococcus sp. At1]|uniref:Ornithine carbamoyltransferase n=1 Tax=Methanimicrococcus hacksteinii TaxID=3028293 RepID=A0ABU3VRV6_9EURY|nr:ornithine carbamoyltransferase [Methanimicrococcus sp. At1]MDV0445630.1 Ornithine carbamoyltransferase [Methanimicrococcus sp. At1]